MKPKENSQTISKAWNPFQQFLQMGTVTPLFLSIGAWDTEDATSLQPIMQVIVYDKVWSSTQANLILNLIF